MSPPHVLIFPFPVQGHLNPMLKLAGLLAHSGILVTFLNTDHNHRLLLRHGRNIHHGSQLIRFESIPDGLEEDNPRKADSLLVLAESMRTRSPPLVRGLLASASPPFTCVVADGLLGFMVDVAEEALLPIIAFRTSSACSFWAYFCIPELIAAGDIPFPENLDMDRGTNAVPGMEGLLRLRDLPSYCRATDVNDPALKFVMTNTLKTTRARGLIFNTIDTLESLALSQIRRHIPNIYTIGPLHAHGSSDDSSTSIYQEDTTCLTWLDRQPDKSVVFVSLGSLALPNNHDLLEIWHGLVDSGHRFLWATRPDLLVTADECSATSTGEKWLVMGWAPQQEVLRHPAVGGFLTHCGWNSTLESMHAGVPMLCWPFFGDQIVSSRFVEKVWEVGLDMKDRCERGVVEKLVRELMGGEGRGENLRRSVEKMGDVVRRGVDGESGSSCRSLQRLIHDIRIMSSEVVLDKKSGKGGA